MDLRKISKQMRLIADSIDDLLGMGVQARIGYRETAEVASDIRKAFKKVKNSKGYKYKPGTHWTQKPENKDRLAKMTKKSARSRANHNA